MNKDPDTTMPPERNSEAVQSLLQQIKTVPQNGDALAPWAGARHAGASAVAPLCELLTGPDPEVARNAKRALFDIIREAGRPGAVNEARTVTEALVSSLKRANPVVQPQLAWMLSEIGKDHAVPALAELLRNKQTREDARGVLIRIPGRKALDALKTAFNKTSDEEFKYALADALRARGESVKGYPSRKTQPVRQTTVTPLQKDDASK